MICMAVYQFLKGISAGPALNIYIIHRGGRTYFAVEVSAGAPDVMPHPFCYPQFYIKRACF